MHAKPAFPAIYEVMEPAWARQYSLKLRGTYYEGFVEDLESLLTKFKSETITTLYGIRRSRYMDGNSVDRIRENEENHTMVLIITIT